MLVIAHAGHWALQAIYLSPLVVLVVIIARTRLQERKAAREADGQPPT